MSKDIFSDQFLGVSKAFPMREDPDTGTFANARGHELVHQSIRMFMTTRIGGRILMERYGMPSVVFENSPASVLAIVRDALLNDFPVYENRAIILHVDAHDAQSQTGLYGIQTNTRYRLKSTGSIGEYEHFIVQERG